MLQPYKIVFLTGTGGLLDGDGKVIHSINLSTEYDTLMAQPWINGGMRVKIEQIKQLLDALPLSSSVSITRPEEAPAKAGNCSPTKVRARWCAEASACCRRRAGDELDADRLRGLIESAFGRTLVPDYFERTALHRAYVSENYRQRSSSPKSAACRISTSSPCSTTRRAKGWVAPWQLMREAQPKLFWRSRHGNPVNAFYDAGSRRQREAGALARVLVLDWRSTAKVWRRSATASNIAGSGRRR